MQAPQNLTQKVQARNGQAPIEAFEQAFCSYKDNRINQLNTRQALVIAARACNSILFGEPHPASFDRDDLSQALEVLTKMATTIEPIRGEA